QPNATGFTDMISIQNSGTRARVVPVVLSVAADLAPTSGLKGGERPAGHLPPHDLGQGIGFADNAYSIEITSAPSATTDLASSSLRWDATIGIGATWEMTIDVHGAQPDDGIFRPLAASWIPWVTPTVVTDSSSLRLLTDWSFADMRRLALSDPLAPEDVFIAAGCPWYFTLFGRDSLWTARMMLPFGAELAGSTLRALARRQGTRHDARAAEQPGRIPHEVRPTSLNDGKVSLPPVYYGSADATALWITTLAEAWRWGLAEPAVEQLLEPLQAAVGWLTENSDADGDGLCEYVDNSGSGLSNQGWKDSGDSVSWHDGALASPPIALVEVQGYAYEAALNAVQLYDHFHLPGTERLTVFAQRLKAAFHDKFWLVDHDGPHLAIALDADKRAVDSTTSNPGHVLGTGLLSAEQEAHVVRRLVSALDCGVGLRTMSIDDARYNPLSYHNGSIWPHDSAICARGMVLAGHPEAAGIVLAGLLAAATAFDGRLPELFGSVDALANVVPYPASCRPQAWAAAVGAVTLWAAAPLLPVEPGKTPRELRGIDLFDQLQIDGFSFGGQRVTAAVTSGSVTFTGLDVS
ncbi:MAG: amylo-alpha-1,6-glucosidase, partial [Ilumatobacteraceae bacterium]